MTNREKQLIRDSFPEIRALAGPVSQLFYGRLFELDPGLRPMFHGDITKQGMKLMDMISAVAVHLDELDTLTPALHAMGQRHTGYGVTATHYETVEESLLWALGQALEAGFDGEVRAAWRTVIRRVSKAMKEGAALAPAVR